MAAASAYVTEERALFEAATEFVVLDAWTKGGKSNLEDDSAFGRAKFKVERVLTYPFGHPTHRVVVRIQEVIPRETVPGQPPPHARGRPRGRRDLGGDGPRPGLAAPAGRLRLLRLGLVFAVCCNSLHRRDKLVAQARAAAGG